MPRVARSAKGRAVDFDMLKIKQQIASAPKPSTVKAREDFIDQKFKRRLKKQKRAVVEKAKVGDTKKETVKTDEAKE
jgi:hypothetical protein